MNNAFRVAGVVLLFACAAADVAVLAQVSAPQLRPREGEVASDPIRCWWKADRTAISVVESFALVLTCVEIETTGITVVPEVNQLELGAIALKTCKAFSGVQRDDVIAATWRYL